MAVAALACGRKAGDDDVGLEAADVPDHVGEDRVVAPDRQRLLRVLGVAEVDGAGEGLLAAVDAPRRQELLRADHAEELALLVADQVLAAVAARHREVRRAQEALVAEVGDQRGVLVVGMRGDVHDAADDGELLEGLLQLRRVHRLRGAGGVRKEHGDDDDQEELAHDAAEDKAEGRRQKAPK